MAIRDRFLQALGDSDVKTLSAIWEGQFPDMPQPANRDEAEIVMRRSQTECFAVPLKVRAYAHRWLTERGIPSGLPDNLKPQAERMYPVVKTSVGIAFGSPLVPISPLMKPAIDEVQHAMEDAVLDVYDGRLEADQDLVKVRMEEARQKSMRQLFGTTAIPR